MEIKSNIYHDENDTIDIFAKDGTKTYLLCATIEDSLHTGIIGHSKLVWLKENEPSAYAELAITGRLQDFIDQYTESYQQQQDTIEKQLTAHFNGDKAYTAAIAREIMRYDR